MIRYATENDYELLKKHDKKIIESYELEVVGNEIYITEQVNNILFFKR